jgi:hypothetical protein
MKTMSAVFLLLTLYSISGLAEGTSNPVLICRATGSTEITEVRMYDNSDDTFRADLSVYSKFSQVPSPPPVTKTYQGLVLWRHIYMSGVSQEYFNLVSRSGSMSSLRTDSMDLAIDCESAIAQQHLTICQADGAEGPVKLKYKRNTSGQYEVVSLLYASSDVPPDQVSVTETDGQIVFKKDGVEFNASESSSDFYVTVPVYLSIPGVDHRLETARGICERQ